MKAMKWKSGYPPTDGNIYLIESEPTKNTRSQFLLVIWREDGNKPYCSEWVNANTGQALRFLFCQRWIGPLITDDQVLLLERQRIFGALAESVLEATDEEIQDEMRQEGLEPDKVAEVTRNILLDAVTSFENGKENL